LQKVLMMKTHCSPAAMTISQLLPLLLLPSPPLLLLLLLLLPPPPPQASASPLWSTLP
jgi:hypothetical protein